MAKSRDELSEWHVDTKGISLAAAGKIRKKDECLHIRAGCIYIRTHTLLKNARCISKSAPQRNFLFSSEETETRRHIGGCTLTRSRANSRTFSEREALIVEYAETIARGVSTLQFTSIAYRPRARTHAHTHAHQRRINNEGTVSGRTAKF